VKAFFFLGSRFDLQLKWDCIWISIFLIPKSLRSSMQCVQPRSGAPFLLTSMYFLDNQKHSDLTLSRAWSLSIGRLPHFSRDTKLATKPAIVDHVESSAWIPYTDDGNRFRSRQVLMLMNRRSTIGAVVHSALKRSQRLQNLLRALRDCPQIFIYFILPRNPRY
jgi:hypothetical protein